MPALKSVVVVLSASVGAFFAARSIPARVTVAGWKERFKQDNQGPGGAMRVCFIPGDPGGRDGKLTRGRQVNSNPRVLLQWNRLVTVSVWAVDMTNRNNEGLQITAVETLLEQTLQGINRATDPDTGQPIGVANVRYDGLTWTLGTTEMGFGKEVLLPITITVPFFDVAIDVATPDLALTSGFKHDPPVE